MRNSLSRKVIKELKAEFGLPEYKIIAVMNSIFGMTAFIIRNECDPKKGKFPTIGIPFFGKFYHKLKYEDIRNRKQ